MVTIEITKSGVFDGGGNRVPVGTQLTFSRMPKNMQNKFRVVSDTEDGSKQMEVATPEPDHESGNVSMDDADADTELRAEYESVLGKKPGPRMKPETMQKHIDEARADGDNSQ